MDKRKAHAQIACQHCQHLFGVNNIRRHERSCVLRPGAMDALAKVLARSDGSGMIIPNEEYISISSKLGLPSYMALLRHFGAWANVATAFGLERNRRGAKSKEERELVNLAEIGAEIDLATEHAQSIINEPWQLVAQYVGGIVRQWDIATKTWQPVRIERRWELR